MPIKDLSAKQRAEIKLDHKVSIVASERTLDEIALKTPASSEFILDCSACTSISLGAGYRLGNVLRLLSSLGPLTARIPPGGYSVEKVPTDFYLTFTRSGLGPAIARHATRIESDRKDVTASLKAYYDRTLSIPAQNTIYITDLHLGVIDTEDENRFGRFVTDALARVAVAVAGIDRKPLGAVIGLCFEGAQNIADHAAKKPFVGQGLFSYLSIKYYKKIFSTDDGSLSTYFKSTQRTLGERQWLEIVVNDDGVGIPARQSQSHEIYRGRLAAEEEVLGTALHHSSVKLRAGDARVRGGVAGEGFTRIRGALHDLKAFASVRTGRCYATFDGASARQEVFRLNRSAFGLPLGYMPGTTLQVVIPLPVTKEKQPGLF